MKISISDEVIKYKIQEYSRTYLDEFYIHNREELDEFLGAIDFLERNRKYNPQSNYGKFEFDDSRLEKGLHDARRFPILVLYEQDFGVSTTYRFIDDTLGI